MCLTIPYGFRLTQKPLDCLGLARMLADRMPWNGVRKAKVLSLGVEMEHYTDELCFVTLSLLMFSRLSQKKKKKMLVQILSLEYF